MKKGVFLMGVIVVWLGIVPSSFATELEVTHWWTSGGEANAVRVLSDAFNATGNHWKDAAIGGGGGIARPIIVSRIIGGSPMDATQLNHGQQARELVEADLMLDLTELAEKEGWRGFVNPGHLLDACTYDGKIYCVPVNIHSWQWLWLNRKVFLDNGMKVPSNWDEFKAAAPKLKEAGVIPLATGDSWNLPGMFNVIQVAVGGPELYRKVLQNKSLEAAKSDEWKALWNEFAIVRDQLVDRSWSGRQWNEATAMVVSGRAAGQIMGDWAQGEFAVAGKKQGKDYECLPGLGVNELLDAGGDAFYFPKSQDPNKTKAQLELASLMMSREVQVKFNLAKGSLPVRGDIDMSSANGCMQKGLNILKNPKQVLMSNAVTWSRDTQAQIEDLVVEFFADPNYSVDKVHKKYVKILSAKN